MTADDTKSFTITLADPCAGVTCPNKCFGYDWCSQKCVDGSCVKDKVIKANSARHCGYVPPAPAQGRLEELTYPASVKTGADVRVGFKIHNTGGSTGTFIARLYQGGTKVGAFWRAVVHAGDRPSGAITAKAPSSGTSVTYTLKLFLET